MASLDLTSVENALRRVRPSTVDRYTDYWQGIAPLSLDEYKHRWWFAFLSIRSQWKANKNAFALLVQKDWESREELEALLHESRIGLVDRRCRAIWEFNQYFDRYPGDFLPNSRESQKTHRNRLAKKLYGIGLAKVSFAFEMCWPRECAVICIDTHIMQMYGVNPKRGMNNRDYYTAERHWLDTCQERDMPPSIVRHVVWDKRQNKRSPRYWTHVLENHS